MGLSDTLDSPHWYIYVWFYQYMCSMYVLCTSNLCLSVCLLLVQLESKIILKVEGSSNS